MEKVLGLDGKPQIEQYGIEPFIGECKKSVWKYQHEWEKMSDQVGYWADMEHPYVTYDNDYIESEWWSLKQIYDKGMLYQGHKIVPYCPRCGTALSSHEVAQGYKNVKEISAIVRFKVKDMENTSLLAWTTTPWTLPSNLALCVNPKETYCRLRCEGEDFIMAKALVEKVFEGKEVDHPGGNARRKPAWAWPTSPCTALWSPDKPAWYVVCDNYVTMDRRHRHRAHRPRLWRGRQPGVPASTACPLCNLVDTQGCMTQETTWPGMFVKEADPLILEDLKERGLLFAAAPLRPRLPLLLAVRYAPAVLRPAPPGSSA